MHVLHHCQLAAEPHHDMNNNDMFTWLRLPNSKFGPVAMITEVMMDFNNIQMVNKVDNESRKHGSYFIFILVSKKVDIPLQTSGSTCNILQTIPEMIDLHEWAHFPVQVPHGTPELIWSIIVKHPKLPISTHSHVILMVCCSFVGS